MSRLGPTPGFRFIFHLVPYFVTALIVAHLLAFYARDKFDVQIPKASVLGLLLLLGAPTWTGLRARWVKLVQARNAARLGAQAIPCIKGRWPGNLDFLIRFREDWKTGYLGQGWREFLHGDGATGVANLYMLWDDTIATDDPDLIKTILTKDFPNFPKGERLREAMNSVLGSGVFNADDDVWR
ncbi:hypothetical protein HGRIS_006759 [Hohenbuehelia grisea]|uniref:Uncharacterized protein n=1 Tax=Hohenbuehelia grisea TaxID=104357 RepID=A0ABR3JB32_9AGAR